MIKLFALLINTSFAEAAKTTVASTQSPIMSFIPMALIFVIFYFLMLKPQKKKLVEEQNMVKSLGKGAEIYTKSGILGTIVGLTEKIVTIEVSEGIKLKVLKNQIGGLSSQIFESDKKDK